MKIIKKIINFIEKNRLLILTLFIATFVINYIYYSNEVTPYGKYSLLCVDFYHQYGPMTYELWHRLLTGSGITYSFFQGLGLPIFRNFLNYLSSPLNILVILFTKKNLLKSFSLIIGLKAILSSGTMIYYLKNKFKSNSWLFVPLAVIYGFSGYYRAYYWNLMWLDGMIWLPLVTLGIENIINNKKWKLYLFSLAIMLFSNYFIGYMICFFSVIYFIIYGIYKLQIKGRTIKETLKVVLKRCLMFGGSSILAGMLVGFAMIPMASSMMSISATGGSIPTTQYYDFEFVDFLMAHFSCVKAVNFKSDEINAPNISVGIIGIYLFFNYVSNYKISKKNKFCYLLLFGIVASFFFIPQLDFIMQAFHVPNDLPYRYSFIYSFVFLILCAYELHNIDKESVVKNIIVFIFSVGLVIAAMKENWAFTSDNMLVINIIILGLFTLFLILGRLLPIYSPIFFVALSFVAAIDAIESTNYTWNISQNEEHFVETVGKIDETIKYIKDNDSSQFYRIDQTSMHTLNDSVISYYNGVTTFSSMAYEDLAKLNNYLGLKGNNINSYEYSVTTPIYDLMFDVKYITGLVVNSNKYEFLNSNTPYSIYRSKYTAGLAFAVDKDILSWHYDNNNPLENHQSFVEATSDVDNVLNRLKPISTTKVKSDTYTVYKYVFDNPGDAVYFYFDNPAIEYFIIEDTLYRDPSKEDFKVEFAYSNTLDYSDSVIKANRFYEDSIIVTVAYKYYIDNDVNLWYIDEDNFNDYYNKITDGSLTITSFKENRIKGQMDIGEDQVVYTSIPYDSGWSAYVDGKKVNTFKIGNALLGFKANEGLHDIELVYHVPYFIIGIVSTISSIVIIYLTKYSKHFYRLLEKVNLKTKKIRKRTKKNKSK